MYEELEQEGKMSDDFDSDEYDEEESEDEGDLDSEGTEEYDEAADMRGDDPSDDSPSDSSSDSSSSSGSTSAGHSTLTSKSHSTSTSRQPSKAGTLEAMIRSGSRKVIGAASVVKGGKGGMGYLKERSSKAKEWKHQIKKLLREHVPGARGPTILALINQLKSKKGLLMVSLYEALIQVSYCKLFLKTYSLQPKLVRGPMGRRHLSDFYSSDLPFNIWIERQENHARATAYQLQSVHAPGTKHIDSEYKSLLQRCLVKYKDMQDTLIRQYMGNDPSSHPHRCGRFYCMPSTTTGWRLC